MAKRTLFGIVAAILALGAFAPATLAQNEPAQWRDNTKPDLREHWTTLEGKAAPTLEKLEGGSAPTPARGRISKARSFCSTSGPRGAAPASPPSPT